MALAALSPDPLQLPASIVTPFVSSLFRIDKLFRTRGRLSTVCRTNMAKGDFVGEFELYVMLALAHLEDAAYGVTIRREIEARTGRTVAIGAVYATLARLEEKGLVRFRVSDPQPVQGGRARKYFSLTGAGARALRHSTAMLARMMSGLSPELRGGRS